MTVPYLDAISTDGAMGQLAKRRPRTPQLRFTIAGVVILVAMIYLIETSFSAAITSVMSPSQLLRTGTTAAEHMVRLQGRVVGTTTDDVSTLAHTFAVSDGHAVIRVTYGSDLPGGFKTGVSVEAQGTFDGRTFTAFALTAKCPTKYQSAH